MSVVRTWGSTAEERRRAYPCDAVHDGGDELWRAVDVDAPAAVVFRWLCQLRVAPYSYDKLDNRGRRSPQTLTPGLEELELGQRFCTIFRLTAFEPGRSITLVHRGAVFGGVAVTYTVDPITPTTSRLVAKLNVDHGRGVRAAVARAVLPTGDLIMMRRQLLNLKGLAEASAAQRP